MRNVCSHDPDCLMPRSAATVVSVCSWPRSLELERFLCDQCASDTPGLRPEGPPQPDLVRIRDLIYQVAGIFHPDNKLRLLQERCGRRMKQLRVQTLREYFECLTIRPIRQAELIALLNEITIGETCFFRNQPATRCLARIVIPNILRGQSPTSLCAVCASGAPAVPLEKNLTPSACCCWRRPHGGSKTGPSKFWPPTQRSLPCSRQECDLWRLQHP